MPSPGPLCRSPPRLYSNSPSFIQPFTRILQRLAFDTMEYIAEITMQDEVRRSDVRRKIGLKEPHVCFILGM